MRRFASLYVQKARASQSTMTKNPASFSRAVNVPELKKLRIPSNGLDVEVVAEKITGACRFAMRRRIPTRG